jgi:quercetin dioxygenase-like cupin family protein
MREIRSKEIDWLRGSGYEKKVLLTDDSVSPPKAILQQVRFRKGESVPPHYHEVQTEAFYFLQNGALSIEGVRHDMGPGDILVCEPGEVHETPEVQEDFSIIVLKINFEHDDTVWLEE